MVIAYKRREVANILWISERGVDKTSKVIKVEVWSSRSKKFVNRYLLTKEVINERPIKKGLKEKVR